jgi:hypothetical protein
MPLTESHDPFDDGFAGMGDFLRVDFEAFDRVLRTDLGFADACFGPGGVFSIFSRIASRRVASVTVKRFNLC